MATQNFASAVHSGSRKGRDASQSNLKDGQSVTKRLQQDLMTLMVSEFPRIIKSSILKLEAVCSYIIRMNPCKQRRNFFFNQDTMYQSTISLKVSMIKVLLDIVSNCCY